MDIQLSTDTMVLFQHGFFKINWTMIAQWVAIGVLVCFAKIAARYFNGALKPSKTELFGETLINLIRGQVDSLSSGVSTITFLPYVATLFLFILTCNLMDIIPFFNAPTTSLSMTGGLALTLFFSAPYYGAKKLGILRYLKTYIEPAFFMLPFNIIGNVTKVLSMSMRLYGNILSGSIIAAVLLALVPYLFPVIMQTLGLLTGSIQAFVFAAIATVTISSGMAVDDDQKPSPPSHPQPTTKKET